MLDKPNIEAGEDITTRTLQINFGPQHPATHGTLRVKMEVLGENVVRVDPEIGFLHTGFEKLGEYHTFNQFVCTTDRMNYMSPLCNNFGFAHAIEELLEIELTPRCQYLRVILCELSRLADHVICTGLQAMDLGAFTVLLWSFVEREKLYDLFEMVTGARLTTSFARVGGMMKDVPGEFVPRCRKFLREFPQTLREIEKMLSRNRIFLDRTVGIAAVNADDVASYGLTGPIARAAGVAYDVRRARPYWVYDELDFDVITRTEGDVFARYAVRMAEMRESVKIISQALDRLPGGPVNIDDWKIVLPEKAAVYTQMESLITHFKLTMKGHGLKTPRNGKIYSCTEATNGELGWYIETDGSAVGYRVRCRPPSYWNYGAMPQMVRGGYIADVVACLSSLNVIAGELDR
ncbi:MAG: NADH-quinone oxidoreductase subunit D [Planctomycetes bacterium]|nr:NADH-quinone oxidoreductase subunit D [Planctomycetota bacterium]MCL4730842.1 NADH-quinone oxidoreductase subunit D [Planctomycetota bacterium]